MPYRPPEKPQTKRRMMTPQRGLGLNDPEAEWVGGGADSEPSVPWHGPKTDEADEMLFFYNAGKKGAQWDDNWVPTFMQGNEDSLRDAYERGWRESPARRRRRMTRGPTEPYDPTVGPLDY